MLKGLNQTLKKNDLLVFRDFIQTRTGLFFPESKFFSIEGIIQSSFEDSPVLSFKDYILYLKSISGKNYLKKLISLLTTNETYFFRGKPHFDLLERHIIPQLIHEKAVSSRTISIWSAGCSTGEEPYSIAILLKKLIPKIADWNINIIASDIDETALGKAKNGEYGQWSFRGLEGPVIHQSFIKKGDLYEIKQEYKSLVTFKTHNLISENPLKPENKEGKFDLILCRNVTIYFEKKTTIALASKFFNVLRDGGFLVVGHAEHSADFYPLFKTRAFPDAIVYQKKGRGKDRDASDILIHNTTSSAGKNKEQNKTLNSNDLKKKQSTKKTNHLLMFIKENKTIDPPPSGPIRFIKQRKVSNEESGIFDKAMQYYFKQNYEMAIDRLLRIIDINDANARACWMLAHIASNRGYFEEAIAWSKRCIKIDPLFKEPYYTLSIIHLARAELDKAIKSIKKAIYIDQQFILGHFVMGNIYHLMKLPSQENNAFKMVRDLLASKPADEVIFEIENLTVGDLINSLECNVRKT